MQRGAHALRLRRHATPASRRTTGCSPTTRSSASGRRGRRSSRPAARSVPHARRGSATRAVLFGGSDAESSPLGRPPRSRPRLVRVDAGRGGGRRRRRRGRAHGVARQRRGCTSSAGWGRAARSSATRTTPDTRSLETARATDRRRPPPRPEAGRERRRPEAVRLRRRGRAGRRTTCACSTSTRSAGRGRSRWASRRRAVKPHADQPAALRLRRHRRLPGGARRPVGDGAVVLGRRRRRHAHQRARHLLDGRRHVPRQRRVLVAAAAEKAPRRCASSSRASMWSRTPTLCASTTAPTPTRRRSPR